MLCLCHCVADDCELEMLAKLVEQEVNERQSSMRHASVAGVKEGNAVLCHPQSESAACSMTSGSIVEGGDRCSLNSEPAADTETPVTETNEECQYSCCIFTGHFSLRLHSDCMLLFVS